MHYLDHSEELCIAVYDTVRAANRALESFERVEKGGGWNAIENAIGFRKEKEKYRAKFLGGF